jgi:hypothetical protein
MAASVQIEDGSLTVKVAICSMSHMNPEIISVETVSPHDPILEDIASKNPVPWRDFRDQQPRLIRVSPNGPDGEPLTPAELGNRMRDLRRCGYRAAKDAGMKHIMNWDPDRLILSVQFVLENAEDSPNLVRPHRVNGAIRDAERKAAHKAARAAEAAES